MAKPVKRNNAGNNPKDIPNIAETPAARITPEISITYHSGYDIKRNVNWTAKAVAPKYPANPSIP